MASRPMVNVIGIRIATPFDGPRPGSAPMMVPIKQPMTASISVKGDSAMENPIARLDNSSISRPSSDQTPGKGKKPKPEDVFEKHEQTARQPDARHRSLGRLR